MITTEILRKICPLAPRGLDAFVPYLQRFMPEFGIDTPVRQQMFIAQVAHESGSFRYVRELASGAAYENRTDLGNTLPGDGVHYKGRGLIQITGKDNYRKCGAALGLDLLSNPTLLEVPEYAVKSACWFWQTKNLNQYADIGDLKTCTKRINGGLNGYEDRAAYYERAKEYLFS